MSKRFLKGLAEGFFDDIETATKSLSDLAEGKKTPKEWFDDGIERRIDRFEKNKENLGDDLFEKIEKMERKGKRFEDKSYSLFKLESNKSLNKGDVIGINRGVYYHYGVYIGDKQVIHYQGDGDTGLDNYVIQTHMDDFMKGQDEFFVLDFNHIKEELEDNYSIKKRFKNIYSSEETIKRAKSKLYEGDYSLLFNNCEHFASWCKTGNKEMRQWFSFLHRRYYKYL